MLTHSPSSFPLQLCTNYTLQLHPWLCMHSADIFNTFFEEIAFTVHSKKLQKNFERVRKVWNFLERQQRKRHSLSSHL